MDRFYFSTFHQHITQLTFERKQNADLTFPQVQSEKNCTASTTIEEEDKGKLKYKHADTKLLKLFAYWSFQETFLKNTSTCCTKTHDLWKINTD